MLWVMTLMDRFVSAVLNSPFHRVMSGSICLVRYTGRRSGNQFTTPTQYAQDGDDEPELAKRLLEVYLRRFPKAGRGVGEGSTEQWAERALVVFCQTAQPDPAVSLGGESSPHAVDQVERDSQINGGSGRP